MSLDLRSGIQGAANINGTEVPTISWNFNGSADTVDFKNSLSGTFNKTASTFTSGSGTVTLDYDFLSPIFGSPISLFPGMTLTTVKLYVDKSATKGWSLPSIIVTSTPTSVNVAGKIGLSFSFKTNGTYSFAS